MSDIATLIHDLEHAVSAGTPARRLEALTKITDLFLAGSGQHTDERMILFDGIFLALVHTIEVNARAQLSRRLACEAKMPPRLLRTLAFDDAITVAAPVLIRSEQLTDRDLVENAKTKSLDHLYAITQRRSLSEPVTDALVERGDGRVVQLVVKNAGARFSERGFGKLVSKAANDEALARYVGARQDIPRHLFLKLLESASAEARARLIEANPSLIDVVQTTVRQVETAISDEVRETSSEHARAKSRVKRLSRTGQFGETDLHAFAAAHDFERAAVALSTLGDYPIDLVERALNDKAPDLVLVLAKAADCCRATARALLTMRSADRRLSPMDVDQALVNFDRLQLTTARRALEFYRMRLRVDEKAHAPEHLAMAWFVEALPEKPRQAGA
ncbi:MAG: DUF2336 domain-containing protein [Pseudorhodoplanes sp.]